LIYILEEMPINFRTHLISVFMQMKQKYWDLYHI